LLSDFIDNELIRVGVCWLSPLLKRLSQYGGVV
jgi:hypothetical protein